MSDSPILIDVETTGLAIVTLNRPAKRNAVTLEMWRRLRDIFGDLGARADVRVVALRGAERHFSSGADLSEFPRVRDTAEAGVRYEQDVDAATLSIMECPKPVVAVLEGYCLGGGLALAMGCDFRIAHESTRFSVPAARLGTVYNLLDCQNLIALVGLATAKSILFNAREFDAKEAQAMGLVELHIEGPVDSALADYVAPLLAAAPLSAAGHKLMLNAAARGEAEARRGDIDAAFRLAMDSEDYREGTRAFAEKRPPVFRGK